MKQRLNKDYGRYGQRWQAETGFSMVKRRLGSAVNGRTYWSQCRELLLMAIAYKIMLLAGFLHLCYRAAASPFPAVIPRALAGAKSSRPKPDIGFSLRRQCGW
jgi:hypothetical protein